MGKTALYTNWITICREGDTIDKRKVEKQWLIDAAETYNRDFREAPIDAEHLLNWFGRFGTVHKLRTQAVNGKLCLQAILEPNMRMIEQNKRGQRLYTSASFYPDFPDNNGKTYLFGLALTDNPACNGLTPINFSSQSDEERRFTVAGAPIEADMSLLCNELEDFVPEEEQKPGMFRKLADTIVSQVVKKLKPENKEGDHEMTKEEYQALVDGQKENNALLTKLVAQQKESGEGGEKPTEEHGAENTDKTPESGKETPTGGKEEGTKDHGADKNASNVELAELAALGKANAEGLSKLTSLVSDLVKKPAGNTEFGKNTGAKTDPDGDIPDAKLF